MSVPSAVKFKKNGVVYESKADAAEYYLFELVRAALKDSGKFICKTTKRKIKRKTGRLSKNSQYWVRKKENDLIVGFKKGGFYGLFQEIGTKNTPKIGALSSSTKENITEITKIQAQYLSALSDENSAASLIDEAEGIGGGE